jgi:hypothetical protein
MPAARGSREATHPDPRSEDHPVTDLAFTLATLAFFALAIAFVRALDRL